MHSFFSVRLIPSAIVLGVALCLSACSMDKTKAPSLAGPSEFALSIAMTATPDVLDRDGSSQSTLSLVARDSSGKPLAGQRFALWLTPANGGQLSAPELTTGSDGRATVVYTAALASVGLKQVTVNARTVGDNYDNGRTQTMTIGLRGFGEPELTSGFTVSIAAPKQFDLVTFDASTATVDGVVCHSACTFDWAFGNEGTATGEVVSYRFQTAGVHRVTLVITGPGGASVTKSQSITVNEGVPPVAKFAVSPSDPAPGQDVFFTAIESTAKGGAHISTYTWDFGNGSGGEGVSASTSYSAVGSYVVVLTVRDSNGLTTSISATVSVKIPE